MLGVKGQNRIEEEKKIVEIEMKIERKVEYIEQEEKGLQCENRKQVNK